MDTSQVMQREKIEQRLRYSHVREVSMDEVSPATMGVLLKGTVAVIDTSAFPVIAASPTLEAIASHATQGKVFMPEAVKEEIEKWQPKDDAEQRVHPFAEKTLEGAVAQGTIIYTTASDDPLLKAYSEKLRLMTPLLAKTMAYTHVADKFDTIHDSIKAIHQGVKAQYRREPDKYKQVMGQIFNQVFADQVDTDDSKRDSSHPLHEPYVALQREIQNLKSNYRRRFEEALRGSGINTDQLHAASGKRDMETDDYIGEHWETGYVNSLKRMITFICEKIVSDRYIKSSTKQEFSDRFSNHVDVDKQVALLPLLLEPGSDTVTIFHRDRDIHQFYALLNAYVATHPPVSLN